ncbi:DPY30 domain-containing protein 2 [Ctenodactylus gundi]
METEYLKRCFGNSLTQALVQVAKVRPSDPVEYLAHWLYHYGKITMEKEKKRQEEIQLKEEYYRSLKEKEMAAMLEEEEVRFQQQWAQYSKEPISAAVSTKKAMSMQEEAEALEEALKPDSSPGTSTVIPQMHPQIPPSESDGQTGQHSNIPRETSYKETFPAEVAYETPPSSQPLPQNEEYPNVFPLNPASQEYDQQNELSPKPRLEGP